MHLFICASFNFVDEDDDKKYSEMNLFSVTKTVDELKLISDDKNCDKMYDASSLTR